MDERLHRPSRDPGCWHVVDAPLCNAYRFRRAESLMETLEVLSDRHAMSDIREAEQQMTQGQV